MNQITYETKITSGKPRLMVRLGRKVVGEIKGTKGDGLMPVSWRYHPKGGKPGDAFPTVAAVKRSIEGA